MDSDGDDARDDDSDRADDGRRPTDSAPPSPGERLLYTLGQLYRRFKRGQLATPPGDIGVWDIAGIIGVQRDIEFISEDFTGTHLHFADAVLSVNRGADFPWQLKDMWDWGLAREMDDLWLQGGDER